MTYCTTNPLYESHSEGELKKMWENIKGNNVRNLNMSLLKAIQKNEEVPLYSKQMFDSEKSKWVPLDLWGAHHIINHRKENLRVRMYMALPGQVHQDEEKNLLKGWVTYDSSYLQASLKDKNPPVTEGAIKPNEKGIKSLQYFFKHVKKDRPQLSVIKGGK